MPPPKFSGRALYSKVITLHNLLAKLHQFFVLTKKKIKDYQEKINPKSSLEAIVFVVILVIN